VIGRVIYDPVILLENCYNIDKTGVILSIFGFIKILISKDNLYNYKGAEIKWIMVTAIKYVSADNRLLLLFIIWLALIY